MLRKIKLGFLKNFRIQKSLLGCVECSSWDNIIVCYWRKVIANVWPRTNQLNVILNIFAVLGKIRGRKICICVAGLTGKISLFMIYVFSKKWGLLGWQSYLFHNCNSNWSSDSVKTIYSLLHFFAAYLCNYNHSGTQLFVSLSLWHVFINDLFCKKRSRSVKFQHAMNQVARIYFNSSH